MNASPAIERPAILIGEERRSETTPVGNLVYHVEVSNILVGCTEEVLEDMFDNQTAAERINDASEPLEMVLKTLGIP